MYMELKFEILKWLYENENEFNRVTHCINHFKEYIYNSKGEYLIGGRRVTNFIEKADKLLYGNMEEE